MMKYASSALKAEQLSAEHNSLAALAKSHRIELLRRHFFGILKTSSIFTEGMQKAEAWGWFTERSKHPWRSKELREEAREFRDYVRQGLLITPLTEEVDNVLEFIEVSSSYIKEALKAQEENREIAPPPWSIWDFVQMGKEASTLIKQSSVDADLQKLISVEVTEFLCGRKMQDILQQVLFSASALSEEIYEYPDWMSERYKGIRDKSTYWYICQMIAKISWQSEFERREK